MRISNIIASMVLHVVLIGSAVIVVTSRRVNQEGVQEQEMFFELVEEEQQGGDSGGEVQEVQDPEPEAEVEEAILEEIAQNEEPVSAGNSVEEHASVVSPPVAVGRITPVYPRSARRKGREGVVVIDVNVSAEGAVESMKLISSSGSEDLDLSAFNAVQGASFMPAQMNEQPIAGEVRMTFEFRLKK